MLTSQMSLNGVESDFNEAEQAGFETLLPFFQQILTQWNLPQDALAFETMAGYSSVSFRSYLVLRMKLRGKKPYVSIPTSLKHFIPSGFTVTQTKSEKEFVRIDMLDTNLLPLTEALSQVLVETIKRYPKDWDCCSRYLDCSNAQKCIHPNQELALGCGYKHILMSGRIFYGEHRNVT